LTVNNKGAVIKGIVIAATKSGSGKTTVALGLMAALKRRGLTVAPFKVGPDFIDPGHHSRITGRVSRNLDGWMLSDAYNRRCFQQAAEGADIALVEGVMGLYDGYDGKSEAGSTAQMAKLLNLPVVLVVDAASMARSAAALVQGFENFDPGLQFAGVIFNNLGSPGHLKYLIDALAGNVRMPCLGGILRNSRVVIPERHLGLVTDDEHVLTEERVVELADVIDTHVDVSGLLERLEDRQLSLADDQPGDGPVQVKVGVARDKAFCFYYQDNLDLLEKAGAELAFFSPTDDACLPPGLDGLYLGGGYPELFARQLSKNTQMLKQIREQSRQGLPVYAECGGFMYLCDALVDLDGHTFPMAGCFPFKTKMSSSLRALGYREITLSRDTILGPAGRVIRGHEFHYSAMEEKPSGDIETVYTATRRASDQKLAGGYQVNRTLGSYNHLHFGSCPDVADTFIDTCKRYRHERNQA
jgi:cobyrinic acid a,c-diamide synthase